MKSAKSLGGAKAKKGKRGGAKKKGAKTGQNRP